MRARKKVEHASGSTTLGPEPIIASALRTGAGLELHESEANAKEETIRSPIIPLVHKNCAREVT